MPEYIPIKTIAVITGVDLENVKQFVINNNIKTKFIGSALYVKLPEFMMHLKQKPLKEQILN